MFFPKSQHRNIICPTSINSKYYKTSNITSSIEFLMIAPLFYKVLPSVLTNIQYKQSKQIAWEDQNRSKYHP